MFKTDYYNKPIINLYNIIANDKNSWSFKVLKKLGIDIIDKEFTEYEFDCIRVDISEYYENEKSLPIDINENEYRNLRDLFDEIYEEYL